MLISSVFWTRAPTLVEMKDVSLDNEICLLYRILQVETPKENFYIAELQVDGKDVRIINLTE